MPGPSSFDPIKFAVDVFSLIIAAAAFWYARKAFQETLQWHMVEKEFRDSEQRVKLGEALQKAGLHAVEATIEVERYLRVDETLRRYGRAIVARDPAAQARIDHILGASERGLYLQMIDEINGNRKTLQGMWSLPASSPDLLVSVQRVSAQNESYVTKMRDVNSQAERILEAVKSELPDVVF